MKEFAVVQVPFFIFISCPDLNIPLFESVICHKIKVMITTLQTQSTAFYPGFITDSYYTANHQILRITFIKHASLLFEFQNKTIYIDPVSSYGDYSKFPKADLILVTHEHQDHLDPVAIGLLEKPGTIILANENSCKILKKGHVLTNGESYHFDNLIGVFAVPAYNTTPDHLKFHPPGRDNGYVLTIGDSRIYLSGDTENIPEMKDLKDIDIAFISVNQPYTMTIPEAVDAAKKISPEILYPYHLTNTDVNKLENELKNIPGVDVMMRPLQ